MDIDEIKETIETATEPGDERESRGIAIWVSFLAMLLAITSLGGNNAGKDMINSNIGASNTYSFYQAKTIRQTMFSATAEELTAILAASPDMSPSARDALQATIDKYRATVERYNSEPSTGEGKKELLIKAKAYEEERDLAATRDPYFDYAEALLQIAIVLSSVSIVTGVAAVLWFSFGLGALGTLLMVNGYFLLVRIPFL